MIRNIQTKCKDLVAACQALTGLIHSHLTFSSDARRRRPYIVLESASNGFVPGIRNPFELRDLEVISVDATEDFVPCVADLSGITRDDLVDKIVTVGSRLPR